MPSHEPSPPAAAKPRPAWLARLARYERPSWRSAAVQLADTLLPYFALLTLMYLGLRAGYPAPLVLLLAVPAGGFLVRLFIIFHDCCHGSYLPSRTAMRILGGLLGVLTFTPFSDWRRSHGIHHSTSGNLDRRGMGDVWTMTVAEYAASSPWTRLGYRLYRHPLVMFGLGPLFIFLIANRLPAPGAKRLQVVSVLLTNAAVVGTAIAASLTIGLGTYLLIQLPVLFVGGVAGVWLFYVQHQFDPSYWRRDEDWGSYQAAVEGSSHYKLPAVLQWFSGNIGLHHIHHLRPRIPNYHLQRCLDEIPELTLPCPLTMRRSLRSVWLNLWDEANRRLVGFGGLDLQRDTSH